MSWKLLSQICILIVVGGLIFDLVATDIIKEIRKRYKP